jgi:hypothetical protein
MSGSGSQSTPSFSQQNQPQAQPQNSQQQPAIFEEGRAFFVRLQKNRLQEYKKFQELREVEMASLIDSL